MRIRDSRDADIPAITAIYAPAVRDGRASFELDPPDEAEIGRRRDAMVNQHYPYLVAEENGIVLGYAYAGAYRPRPAYRFTVENSVYVSPLHQRGGVGRALLEALIAASTARGYRLMVAVIGDSANLASIALHRRLGFRDVGILPAIGWKHEQWLDTVLMVLPLGIGSAAPP